MNRVFPMSYGRVWTIADPVWRRTEGGITNRVDVVEGLERAPEPLDRVFEGTHPGKLIVEVPGGSRAA